ncbi:hypothetical protein [Bradyrhizobium sp.]|uniref:hypothetical protein n=1 Tax=Bradyrhizobium sp. TaxID=376 RepID=UPI003D120649
MLRLVAGSGDASGRGVSDESVNAAVTIGAGSGEAGVVASAAGASVAGVSVADVLAAGVSVIDLLAVATSAVANAIGWSVPATMVPAILASAVLTSAVLASAIRTGAKRSTIGAAPEPNATSHTRTETGKATSRHNDIVATNRGFMITVSNRAGSHSQACDAGYLWSHDVDKQWRKRRIFNFQARLLPNCNVPFSRFNGGHAMARDARK